MFMNTLLERFGKPMDSHYRRTTFGIPELYYVVYAGMCRG